MGEELDKEKKGAKVVREIALGKEITRDIFINLATTLVSIAIGFSIIFATELGIVGIFVFIIIAVSVLSWWWAYLGARLKYVRPGMSFPTIDAFLLIVVSCFPCAVYGIGNFQWPSYSILLVLASLFAVWSVWWHHTIQKFPKEISKYGEEGLSKHYRQIFAETAIIFSAGLFLSIMDISTYIPNGINFGVLTVIDIGFIIFGALWVNIRERSHFRK